METRHTEETAYEHPKSTEEELRDLLEKFIDANDRWQSQYSTEAESDAAFQESVDIQDEFQKLYFALTEEEQKEMDEFLDEFEKMQTLTLIKRNDKYSREHPDAK